ncbi:hypothetical protein ONK27_27330, partial [Salmonella enterica subsp. enterica serovar Virginia]|nr:hypothetical protein [Salmonella enterica subsp. enterica serovar Virginia]
TWEHPLIRNGLDLILSGDTGSSTISLLKNKALPVGTLLVELVTCDIPVPTDVRVATEFSETAPATLKSVNDVKEDEQILDIGDA